MAAIYKILNKITGKFYIGSTKSSQSRKRDHWSSLKNNRHPNPKLQHSWNIHGADNFEFIVLIECLPEERLRKEQELIDSLVPYYNISKSARAPMEGRNHSPETLARMKGRPTWNKGIPRTEEEKLLMSQNRKGIPCPEYIKERFRTKIGPLSYWYGKNHSADSKAKQRTSRKDLQRLECSNEVCYFSQKDAAISLEIRQGHISEHLQGKRPNVKGFTFKQVKEEVK